MLKYGGTSTDSVTQVSYVYVGGVHQAGQTWNISYQ